MLPVATAIQEVCYCPLLAFIRSFSRLSQDASYLRTCVKGCSKIRRVLAKSRLILDEMAVAVAVVASYLRRLLRKTRLIFSRINGAIDKALKF